MRFVTLDLIIMVKSSKTWLIVKEDHYSEAELIFAGSGVRLTKEGRPHLGAPLGTSAYRNKFLSSKVIEWCAEIEALAASCSICCIHSWHV